METLSQNPTRPCDAPLEIALTFTDPHALDQDGARELVANIAGFFQVLHAWSSALTSGTVASMEVRDDR